jgi:putative protease
MIKTKKPELLCPAGNMEKLETALIYGADAVYFGAGNLNLRSQGAGFGWEELPEALKKISDAGASSYFCLNAYPREKDLDSVRADLDKLAESTPDGLIVADPGVALLARKTLPEVPLHISTQANTGNSESVRFWKEFGAARVNLARELSALDIRDIAEKCPDTELEIFVHGAMCMALSGRCFMSAWMNNRSANMGRCTHPCRFEYKATGIRVEEKTRPGEVFWESVEDEDFTTIYAAEDLCLIRYIKFFTDLGIAALKIEGRTKSSSYLAQAVDVYRTSIDAVSSGGHLPKEAVPELRNVSTRPLSTGFLRKNNPSRVAMPPESGEKRPVLARLLEKRGDDSWLVSVKSRWEESRNVTVIVPALGRPSIATGSYSFEKLNGEKVDTVHSGTEALLRCDSAELQQGYFIRLGE